MIGVGIPLFYVLEEIVAYYCYCELITRCIPTYNHKAYSGCNAATSIIDQIIVDYFPTLIPMFPHHMLVARTWAFKYILTCCSSFKPVSEALKLWDFFILQGFHFTPLCVLAQIILNQKEFQVLSASELKKTIDKGDFTINAKDTIEVAIGIFDQLSTKMKYVVVNHTLDSNLAEEWMKSDCLKNAQSKEKK
jgi:hypothetical protein